MTHKSESERAKIEIEMERIVPLAEAARLRGVSVDTLRRRFSHQFIRVSPRRLGMRVRDAIAATADEGAV
jgi:hypothetical protein